MQRKTIAYILLLCCAAIPNAIAQNDSNAKLPTISAGVGIMSFSGDIGNQAFSKKRIGSHLSIEENLGKHFAIRINGLYGYLSDSELNTTQNLNFSSKILQGDLNLQLHFPITLSPYIAAGIGYMKFDPYGDLKNVDGLTYNYWSDGSIHSLAETDSNSSNSLLLKRDYKYESRLTDSSTDYQRNAIVIPISAGLQWNFSELFSAKFGATYHFALTDWIDNIESGENDAYLYSYLAINYHLTAKKRHKSKSKSSREVRIVKSDKDADGVNDFDDECPNSPKGIEVDASGCILDKDDDGVPDYLDKEPKTAKGAMVNSAGISLPTSEIKSRQEEFKALASDKLKAFEQYKRLSEAPEKAESINVKRNGKSYVNKGTTSTADEIANLNFKTYQSAIQKNNKPLVDSTNNSSQKEQSLAKDSKALETDSSHSVKRKKIKKKKTPKELRIFDKDNSNDFSTQEINNAIDSYFKREKDITVPKLNRLVDAFFEQ